MLFSVKITFHEDLSKLFNTVKIVNNEIIKKDKRLEIIIGNYRNLENKEIYYLLKNFKNFEIKVINNSLEKGSENNRNTAMRISKCKFFAFLDSANIYFENIRIQMAQVKKSYNFIYTNYSFLETGKIIKSLGKTHNIFHIFFLNQ